MGSRHRGAARIGALHAMNMRAAEAIVSSAPKAMKIFPINEVWSQVESSLLAGHDRRGGSGRRFGRGQRHRSGLGLLQRAVEIVELIGGDDLGLGGRRGVGRLVRGGQQHRVGFRRHRPGAAGRRLGGCQLRVGVGDRWRDRGGAVVAIIGDVSRLRGVRGFQRHLAGFPLHEFFRVARLGEFVERNRRAGGFFGFWTCGRCGITRRGLQWSCETHKEPCR